MYKLKKKNKIYRLCDDFYKQSDLKDPDTPKIINLTIEDFNASGEVANPRAPCVVTTIDPEYTRYATLQHKTRKFRMKTDILTLREITRKKFMIFATQERYLEKQREAAFQEGIYTKIKRYQEFIADALHKSESNAFNDMRKTQKQLEELQKNRISDELKDEISKHQRVLMEVQEEYRRFSFLIKLIGYFDEIIAQEDIEEVKKTMGCVLRPPEEVINLQISERNTIGEKEVICIMNYMNEVVRPYLAKRNHLNASIWIEGYERIRQKIFNYSWRFTNVALLNHIVVIVSDKSEKTIAHYTKEIVFLKDPDFLQERIQFLKQRSVKVLDDFEKAQKRDALQNKLRAILPVILEKIELLFSQNNVGKKMRTNKSERNDFLSKKLRRTKPMTLLESKTVVKSNSNIIEKVEKLQWYLMSLLQDLEKFPLDQCKKIEYQVRKRIQTQKDLSRRVLAKQNRLQNWMEHFKRHELLRRNN